MKYDCIFDDNIHALLEKVNKKGARLVSVVLNIWDSRYGNLKKDGYYAIIEEGVEQ